MNWTVEMGRKWDWREFWSVAIWKTSDRVADLARRGDWAGYDLQERRLRRAIAHRQRYDRKAS